MMLFWRVNRILILYIYNCKTENTLEMESENRVTDDINQATAYPVQFYKDNVRVVGPLLFQFQESLLSIPFKLISETSIVNDSQRFS